MSVAKVKETLLGESVENDLKKLKINLSYEEISSMSKFMFKKIMKEACEYKSLTCLTLHCKSK